MELTNKPLPLQSISETELDFNDTPRFAWIRVRDAINLIWESNAKLHSADMKTSVKRHGFQELPKLDINLKNVGGTQGAIKAGNGRIEALFEMERSGEYELPRGLAQEKLTGFWVLPILIGTDAESEAAAAAYAVDSNNLTLGENFDIWEQARLWDGDGYAKLLKSLQGTGMTPVTMNETDIQAYLQIVNGHVEGKAFDEGIADGVVLEATFRIKLPADDANTFEQELDQLLAEFPQAKKEKVI